jgi:hypothetical protein
MRKLILLSILISATIAMTQDVTAQNGPLSVLQRDPCRLVDTRSPNSTNGGPIFNSNTTRDFTVRGLCGIPATARAVSLNVAVTGATAQSWLALWPSGQTRPNVSTINFTASDRSLANGAIAALSTNAQDLSVYNNFGNVHVILDVTGYFQ